MKIRRSQKTPGEAYPINADFGNALESGDTIAIGSSTVTSINQKTGADSSSTLLTGSPYLSGDKLFQKINAGTAGDVHEVLFKAITAGGHTYERTAVIEIVSKIYL